MAYQDILETNLRAAEGEILWMYRDQFGYATIAVGHLIDQRKGGRISKAASAFILNEDMADVDNRIRDVVPSFDSLSDVRKAAIAEMDFQLGQGGLAAFTTFLGLIASQDFAGAADDLATTKWAQQVPSRAKRIADMIRGG